jgi:hypothetical protein
MARMKLSPVDRQDQRAWAHLLAAPACVNELWRLAM